MPLVGFGIVFLGYSVFYYGLTQVQGQNYGLFDLVIPGRFAKAKDNPRDPSASTSSAAFSTADQVVPGTPGTSGGVPSTAAPSTAAPSTGGKTASTGAPGNGGTKFI